MLRCPVADAIMWEPELDGVVIATSDKHNASRVHFVVLTWHKLSEDTPKVKRAPPPKPCLNSDLKIDEKISSMTIFTFIQTHPF